MAVMILESLVQRGVSVVAHVGTEMRIGTQADRGLTSALLSANSSPSYPALDRNPKERPCDKQDNAACRAGRSGSFRGVLASRSAAMFASVPVRSGQGLMRKPVPVTAVDRDHREQLPAGALSLGHRGILRPWPAATFTGADATPTAGAFTASPRGERTLAG